jgi:hypothetical protein
MTKKLLIILSLLIPTSHALSAQDAKPESNHVDKSVIQHERLKAAGASLIALSLAAGYVVWGIKVYNNVQQCMNGDINPVYMLIGGELLPKWIVPYALGSLGLTYLRYSSFKNRLRWAFATDEQWQERLEKKANSTSESQK